MNNAWKQSFYPALKTILEVRISTKISNEHDLVQIIAEANARDIRGIWTEVSKQIGLEKRKARDYYYNTYVKQFSLSPKLRKSYQSNSPKTQNCSQYSNSCTAQSEELDFCFWNIVAFQDCVDTASFDWTK